jgi:DNA repair protein RecN (Recombination protein N)
MALLRTLRIRRLVIIEDLTVEFGPGLNLLTGETGAGKSILVDALSLVAGDRADRSLVRAGEAAASVEALFAIDGSSSTAAWLRERGVADVDEGQVVIRREVAAEGAGRVMLNGSPCTLGMLRELAEQLLELHGQHDPKSLLVAERHLQMLDAFGNHAAEQERVRLAHAEVQQAAAVLADLRERRADRVHRIEELQRTVREIDQLAPRSGELEQLERERRVLRNAGRMADLLDRAVAMSYEGEPAAASLSAAAASQAEELAELDPALEEAARRLRSAALEIEDAGSELRAYRDGADFDPARLEEVEARKAALERACLRHATDEAGLLALRGASSDELGTLGSLDEKATAAERRLEEGENAYLAAASKLTRRRESAAKRLETAVQKQFRALALGKARFRVELVPAQGEAIARSGNAAVALTPAGAERAEFLLAANPGEPLFALRRVASGGELARVMLALHVVAEIEARGRVLVFDEIDAGVGGAVADAVGARLRRLADAHQLLCITHLPQVAAYADRHFSVRKRIASGRTHAGIASLSSKERVEELARMLGGKRPTPASRRHASELLHAAGRVVQPQSRSEA